MISTEERACKACGKRFTATRRDHVYCSHACAKRISARKQRTLSLRARRADAHPGKNGRKTGFIGMSARKSFEWYETHLVDPELAAFARKCKETAEW